MGTKMAAKCTSYSATWPLRDANISDQSLLFLCHKPKKWGVRYPFSKMWGTRTPRIPRKLRLCDVASVMYAACGMEDMVVQRTSYVI